MIRPHFPPLAVDHETIRHTGRDAVACLITALALLAAWAVAWVMLP